MNKSYPAVKKDKSSAVRLPKGLLEELNKFLETDYAKKSGYLYKVDVVSEAVRDFLERYRFRHLNMMEDNVKIVDFTKDRIATIFFKNSGEVWCDLCESEDCDHIDYALEQEDIVKELKRGNWVRKRK